jgi:hypothetical protein
MSFHKMSKRYVAGLIIVAAFFDLLSLIPGLNVITTVAGQIVMAGLFRIGGVNVFKDKKAVTYALATLVEIFPQTSFLPLFLVETAAIISLSWSKRL